MPYLDDEALARDLNRQRLLSGQSPIDFAFPQSGVPAAPRGINVTPTAPLQVAPYNQQRPGPRTPERTREDNSFGALLSSMFNHGGGGGIREMLDRLRQEQAKRAVPTPNVTRGQDLPAPPGTTAAPPPAPPGPTPQELIPGLRPPPTGEKGAPPWLAQQDAAHRAMTEPGPAVQGVEKPAPSAGASEILANQRKDYSAQLEANPGAKLKLAALMLAEEGGDPQARTALAETVFNRGVSRKVPSIDAVMDPKYYQPMHDGSGNYEKALQRIQSDPQLRAQVFSEIDQVKGGSNVSNLATDNASGSVARNSATNQTMAFQGQNGEGFFRKDVHPEVHGSVAVNQTRDWYHNTIAAQADEKPGAPAAPATEAPGWLKDSSGINIRPVDGLPPAPAAPAPYDLKNPPGRTAPGTLDPGSQPAVQHPDGSISTVRTMGFNLDGKETNIPTVSPDGRMMSNEEAIKQYRASGNHLGQFDTPQHAGDYAQALHDQEAQQIGQVPKGVQPRTPNAPETNTTSPSQPGPPPLRPPPRNQDLRSSLWDATRSDQPQPPQQPAPSVTPNMAKAIVGAVKADEAPPAPPPPPGAQPVPLPDAALPTPGSQSGGGPGPQGALTLPQGNAPQQLLAAAQGGPGAMQLMPFAPPPQVQQTPIPTPAVTPQPIGSLWEPPIPWADMQGWGWGGGGGSPSFDFGGFGGFGGD